jgi:hypothetical protein
MEKSKTIEATRRKSTSNNRNSSKKESKPAVYTPKKNDLFLPNISPQNNSILKQIYTNKELHGPLYLFTENQKEKEKELKKKMLKPKRRRLKYSYINQHYNEDKNLFKEIQEFNVFNSEDAKIRDLMKQFYDKSNKKSQNKLNRRKVALNKLYNISPEYDSRFQDAKKRKRLNLDEYQNNILTSVSVGSMGKEKIMDLVQNFNNLKHECDSVKPLPPINLRIIEDHVYNQNRANKINVKKMRLKEFLEQSNEPKDEFEEEEKLIKSIKSYKVLPKFKRNKNYDFLPSYLRESLNKNLKFHL